ncbi:MAG: 16S rRNA (guanine(527)-N(7))-methyltransferase RsmG [Bacteroidales bacterium]|nr:16S rRNA (guanine(527)-N(7))-methyltransferase RsmG [Bacteroidales bacterium]
MDREITRYFPSLTAAQKERFMLLGDIYEYWNSRINLISRKDIGNFYIHHVLHSLSVAKVIRFREGTRILDVGTGGGFPGIPLAIMFHDSRFFLLDSIEKKTKVVSAVVEKLGLENVTVIRKRAEEEKGKFDFVVSRAVMDIPGFVKLAGKNIDTEGRNALANGIIYLKGGDIEDEISPFRKDAMVWEIKEFFSEPFFETKKIIYIPVLNTKRIPALHKLKK